MPETKEAVSLANAFEIVDKSLTALTMPTQILPTMHALGRIVAGDQISRLELPPFDKSAMDGYAVLADDERTEYRLLETVKAGDVPSQPLIPGTATKIMTGAPVPKGTGKVIMIEKIREADGKIRVLTPEKKNNICRQGEDVRCGEIVVPALTQLGPLEVANLISVGITDVEVTHPLRVAVISTGDEIVDSFDQLAPGKIMNSNGPMLAGLCREYGFEVVSNFIVPDELDATVSAFQKALDIADIVIVSGGVSVGDFDFVGDAMKQAGLKMHFNRVHMKPGRPTAFASRREKAVFGLPGNPVAVYLTFHLFVLRAAKLMVGREPELHYIELPLRQSFERRKAERLEHVPSRLTSDGQLEPVEFHGSAHLQALLKSDGFFVVPEGKARLCAGDRVRFLSFKGSLL